MVIVPSDTIDIPSIMNEAYPASTGTTSTIGKLTDSTQDFTTNGIEIGMIVQNHTTATKSTITAIDSATVCSLSGGNQVGVGHSYSIYTEATKDCVFYVGVSGNVAYVTAGGDESIMVAAPVGWHPVNISKVLAAGTTASSLLAGW